MDDLSFRAEFHRALDPIAPSAPWLRAAVRDGLRLRRRKVGRVRRRLQRLRQPAWLLPAVAVLLTIAIIVGVVVGIRLLSFNPTIPVRPPQHGLAAPPGCPGWGTNASNSSQPASDRMASASSGWAFGAVRTTDGGADWRRVAPADMLADALRGEDPRAYPPAYTDYFLDANHAWLAYGLPSRTSCFDHVTVFATADGGQTWSRSHPVIAAIQADTGLQLMLDFIDAQRGWLLVLANGRIAPDWFIYSTSDGGMDWQLVSRIPLAGSACSLNFISPTVGFLGGCINVSGPTPYLFGTRDGGKTWQEIVLPAPAGTMFSVNALVFFNQRQGIVHLTATRYAGNMSIPVDDLDVTDDGGSTWRTLPPANLPGYSQAFGFADPSHFYVLVSDSKGSNEWVYRSVDGGLTWSLATGSLNPLYQTPQLLFVDSQHGFIDEPAQEIGQAPLAFLATSDGGKTWKDVHPQLT